MQRCEFPRLLEQWELDYKRHSTRASARHAEVLPAYSSADATQDTPYVIRKVTKGDYCLSTSQVKAGLLQSVEGLNSSES